jgi:DNA replication and repair protein RecF
LKKEILFDGVKRKIGEVVGCFKAVLFLPQMLDVVVGSPEDRRRFINLALAQIIPRYTTALLDYNTALTQRNALLKQLAERGGDPAQLNYWDEQLSISGALLIYSRIQAIQELDRIAAPIHRELTHGNEILRLSYDPSYDPMPMPEGQILLPVDAPIDRTSMMLDPIQNGFLEHLRNLHEEEISRGVTTTGPHRDEIRFLSNGIDLGIYGSRGQVRTVMLALKLAEMYWMHGKCGYWPVLLLDEVLAELDYQRRRDLLSHVVSCKQVFLTTTDRDLFTPEFLDNAQIWAIKGGKIFTEVRRG